MGANKNTGGKKRDFFEASGLCTKETIWVRGKLAKLISRNQMPQCDHGVAQTLTSEGSPIRNSGIWQGQCCRNQISQKLTLWYFDICRISRFWLRRKNRKMNNTEDKGQDSNKTCNQHSSWFYGFFCLTTSAVWQKSGALMSTYPVICSQFSLIL